MHCVLAAAFILLTEPDPLIKPNERCAQREAATLIFCGNVLIGSLRRIARSQAYGAFLLKSINDGVAEHAGKLLLRTYRQFH